MTTHTNLNVADQALIVDLLIKASNESNSVTCCKHYLEIIQRVKGLEIKNPLTDGKTESEKDAMLNEILNSPELLKMSKEMD